MYWWWGGGLLVDQGTEDNVRGQGVSGEWGSLKQQRQLQTLIDPLTAR